MAEELPATLANFQKRFPAVWEAYAALRDACDGEGPLDPKTAELIKIAVEVARGASGGLIAHATRARRAGATDEEILHAVAITAPLVGFPAALAAEAVLRDHGW